MAYTQKNFKTKSDLKKAVKEYIADCTDAKGNGLALELWSPGPFPTVENGETTVEGPQYPAPHRWYARVRVVAGRVVEVLS